MLSNGHLISNSRTQSYFQHRLRVSPLASSACSVCSRRSSAGIGRPNPAQSTVRHLCDPIAYGGHTQNLFVSGLFRNGDSAQQWRKVASRVHPVPELLGRVDGFDQDEAESKRDERAVILRRLLASKCDALKALELANRLFDACPRLGECFRKEGGYVFGVGSMRDCRTYSASAYGFAIWFGVVALVSERGTRIDVGADVEKRLEVELSVASPPVRWKAIGKPPKSVFK